jgi:uncharacterized protein (UPF0261 family)
MSGDRGASVTAMAEAFAHWIMREPGIGGVISAGGSGGTTLATAGMRVLPVGYRKSWSRRSPPAMSRNMSVAPIS